MADPAQVRKFIYEELDLEPVRERAKVTFEWDDAKARQAEACYRDFLWVCWYAVDGGTTRLPAISVPADQMWHHHILQTKKYRDDCQAIFGPGWSLDHYPSGSDGEARVTASDMQNAESMYQEAGADPCLPLRSECIWFAANS